MVGNLPIEREIERHLRNIEQMYLYCERLQKMLGRRNYDYEDPLSILVRNLSEELYTLKVWTYYLMIGHGVGFES